VTAFGKPQDLAGVVDERPLVAQCVRNLFACACVARGDPVAAARFATARFLSGQYGLYAEFAGLPHAPTRDLTRWRLRAESCVSRGNFLFFETGQPHEVIAAQLINKRIEIARAFPPFEHWVRISIGLPAENVRARGPSRRAERPIVAQVVEMKVLNSEKLGYY
jgi:hypothetical protein